MFDRITELYGCLKVYGPYQGKDGRRRCVLRFPCGRTTSKAYSRLLVEAELGRILSDDEEVDHADGDNTNDDPNNLQVLSRPDHRKKSGVENSKRTNTRVEVLCPECGRAFMARRYRLKLTASPCCSRRCASRFSGANQYGKFRVDGISKVCDNSSVD